MQILSVDLFPLCLCLQNLKSSAINNGIKMFLCYFYYCCKAELLCLSSYSVKLFFPQQLSHLPKKTFRSLCKQCSIIYGTIKHIHLPNKASHPTVFSFPFAFTNYNRFSIILPLIGCWVSGWVLLPFPPSSTRQGEVRSPLWK